MASLIRPILCVLVGLAFAPAIALADEQKDYGEYLSGECTSCHKLDGTGEDIPSIIGRDPEQFVAAMRSFKNGERKNQAMVSVAKSLDDEQLKALSLYFGSLEPK